VTQAILVLVRPSAALFLAGALAGCTMTPEEIRVIEVENELLRQEIQTVKENCTYYREVEVRPESPSPEQSEEQP
jgi:hypothetical protein